MAILGGDHSQLAFIFGVLGNVISFLVYLAPMPTFYGIWKKKSTEGFQSVPYLVALFSSMLWLYYAMLKRDAPLLITINAFGCFIEMFYIITFIFYAPKGSRNLSLIVFGAMNVGLFGLILLVTKFVLHDWGIRVRVLGFICVTVSVIVFAAPLVIVVQVVRTKSVQYMPLGLSIFLTLSATMWLGYGLSLHDFCIAFPNVLGFFLGVIQMMVYAKYRKGRQGVVDDNSNTEEEEKDENSKEQVIDSQNNNNNNTPVINIVVVNPLGGTCEVFPISIDATALNQQLELTKKGAEQEAAEKGGDEQQQKKEEEDQKLSEQECAV